MVTVKVRTINTSSANSIDNAPPGLTESEIFGLFSTFGEVTTVRIDASKRGTSLFFTDSLEVHVDFAYDEDAKDAVDNLHMSEIKGCVISCSIIETHQ